MSTNLDFFRTRTDKDIGAVKCLFIIDRSVKLFVLGTVESVSCDHKCNVIIQLMLSFS